MDIPASTASAAPAASVAASPVAASPVATGDASPSNAPTAGASAQPDSTSAAPASVTAQQPEADTSGQQQGAPAAQKPAAPAAAPEAAKPADATDATDAASTASTEDMTITFPDTIAPEMIDQGMLKAYTDMAKATGLTPEQAQKAANWYVEHTQHMQQQNRQAGETYLRQLWGPDFGKNMETTRLGIATLDKFMGGDISTQLVHTGLADLPVMARIFHFFGDALSENSMSSGTPGVGEERPASMLEHVTTVINQSKPRQ